MPLGPKAAIFFKKLGEEPLAVKPFWELPQADGLKQAREVGIASFGEMATPFPEDITADDFKRQVLELPCGYSMPIHIYRPKRLADANLLPTMIYFYGGGFCLNLNEFQKAPCAKIAEQAGCQVITVEYPLAPEHKAEFIVQASYEALLRLAREAEQFGIDSANIIVAGCSSGGAIAAAIVNRSLQTKEVTVAQQILISPLVDASLKTNLTGQLTKAQDADLLLPYKALEFMVRTFAPEGTDQTTPTVSPLYNQCWEGLPFTLILNGEYDRLRNDGVAYARRIEAAGKGSLLEHRVLDGQTHNFFSGRGVLDDGEDPANVIATYVQQHVSKCGQVPGIAHL